MSAIYANILLQIIYGHLCGIKNEMEPENRHSSTLDKTMNVDVHKLEWIIYSYTLVSAKPPTLLEIKSPDMTNTPTIANFKLPVWNC